MPAIDVHSRTWIELVAWATGRIETYRTRLERVGVPEHEANALRGRIAALREFTGLPEAIRLQAIPYTEADPG